ncbi:YgaP family membrane protein [Nocardia sp. NPDC004340]
MTATRRWTIDRIVPVLAGTMVLISIALVLAFSPWWLLLTTFVAANLLLYGFAGWCPVTLLLRRLGVPRTGSPTTERTA